MNTVIISSHVLLEGAAHALRDYLLKRKSIKLLFISLPFVDQPDFSAEIYRNQKLKEVKKISRKFKIALVDYLFDFVWVLYHSFRFGKVDLFIGIDPLNAAAGLMLRKFNKVGKVIYYGIDFVPVRFGSKILNSLFHRLEPYCVKHSDEVWNVSDRMKEGRKEFLGLDPDAYKQKTVPIGIYPVKNKRIRHNSEILFVGHLLKKQGVQKVLEALPIILKKIPETTFTIVGGGEYESHLIKKAQQLNIYAKTAFKGWVKDKKELAKIMAQADVAVACYVPETKKLKNFSYYADPTKIKEYLNSGLAVIVTDVPYNAKEIQEKECGIIVEYKKEAIAQAIIGLLKNQKKLEKFQQNASDYAKKFKWERIFDKAFTIG